MWEWNSEDILAFRSNLILFAKIIYWCKKIPINLSTYGDDKGVTEYGLPLQSRLNNLLIISWINVYW